jgi:hypothetical protein
VCTYIGTRDLVQEHIAYKVWPLASECEVPKETAAGSSQGGLVYLKYTFRFRNQFDKPNDDWLDAIEATSDEILGAYSKAEDESMTTAFDAHDKKRLNRVFDVNRFVYPDYCYPMRKQGRKRKTTISASTGVSRSKKIKVLTCRPSRIETVNVPKLSERVEPTPGHRGYSCCADWNYCRPCQRARASNRKSTKATENESSNIVAAANYHRHSKERRMASVLEAVLESVKTPPSSSTKASGSKTEEVPKIITVVPLPTPKQVLRKSYKKILWKRAVQRNLWCLVLKHLPRVAWTISFDMLREGN